MEQSNKEYKTIFLDTCVLSEIGRMNEKDRNELLYRFVTIDKLKIILTPFNIMELEDMYMSDIKQNVYDFLNMSIIGFAKNSTQIMKEEVQQYFSNNKIDPIAFHLNCLEKEMNFEIFKDLLLKDEKYINNSIEHNIIIEELQKVEKPPINIDEYFQLIVFNRILKEDKEFSQRLKGLQINYNKIPSVATWAYSYVHKIGSSALKKKAKEINDVSMSYIAPYVDIIITEKKQYARYNEIKKKKIISLFDDKILKRYSDVIIKKNNRILFEL